jgi:hypothetical protein
MSPPGRGSAYVSGHASGTDADPACLACMESCRLIVVTEDNPFAQIICMLECVDCPG